MGREVRRVPIDFDWPMNKTWEGFLNPYYKFRSECPACSGTGLAPMAKLFKDQWYGYAPFDSVAYGCPRISIDSPAIVRLAERNSEGRSRAYFQSERTRLWELFEAQWSHHLIQADVNALIAAGRLLDFTHTFKSGDGWVPKEPAPTVTATEVNEWSIGGFGHDSINQWVCVKARCEREGHEETCKKCDGHGDHWPSKAQKKMYEEWEQFDPPTGDGFQMWETTSEGSPISPVFGTPENLARWLADNGASSFGDATASYESWLAVAKGGFAPSAVMVEGVGMMSGVEAVGRASNG